MGGYVLRRLGISVLTIFLITVLTFALVHLLPGDPAKLALGSEASEEDVETFRHEMNLDEPLIVQYGLWIRDLFRGNMGYSITYSREVNDIIGERLPRTLSIGLPALLIAVIIGILFGVISAIKRGKIIDQILTFFTTLGIGTPVFWLGILGIYVFAMQFHILPIQGYTSPFEDFGGYIYKAAMPVICLSIGLVASVARQTRSNMLEVINQDYIRTARANGLAECRVIFRHSLKNALIPVITIIAMQVRVLVGGSLIVEQVFNVPGIGTLITTAVSGRDYMVIQSIVFIISLVIVFCNFFVDIMYGIIDPKVRKSWRK